MRVSARRYLEEMRLSGLIYMNHAKFFHNLEIRRRVIASRGMSGSSSPKTAEIFILATQNRDRQSYSPLRKLLAPYRPIRADITSFACIL